MIRYLRGHPNPDPIVPQLYSIYVEISLCINFKIVVRKKATLDNAWQIFVFSYPPHILGFEVIKGIGLDVSYDEMLLKS